MSNKLKIRDFLYLDVEKMKSIFSQLDEGLMESYTTENGDKKHLIAKEGASGNVLIAKLKGELEQGILWENKQSETKTLHDHMFNLLEQILIEEKEVFFIEDDENLKRSWENGDLNELISDTSFVLTKSRIVLDDYNGMETLVSNFNDIGKAFYYIENDSGSESVSKDRNKDKVNQKAVKRKEKEGLRKMGFNIENKQVESLKTLLSKFFKDRLILKLIPFLDKTHLRFVGILDENNLRENIGSIIFKYGSAPEVEWSVLGQISWIPPKNHNPEIIFEENTINPFDIDLVTRNNLNMEIFFEEGFNKIRGLDSALSPKFPYVIFTPIAIYRE